PPPRPERSSPNVTGAQATKHDAGNLSNPTDHGDEGPRMAAKATPIKQANPLLTIGEVLAELRVARSTFDTWRMLGTAPACIKLPNGQLRISRSVLDVWLNAHVEAAEVA
ncbi:helix-turn-helix transcriptional regulator, partial [Actinomadura sp. HBU206391]|uniref:helix-turn-helix transcriptional regulator n=1 Tax=Actinomadura sp. HBU206391 TaxID=2731692 RepID=UPI0021C8C6C6